MGLIPSSQTLTCMAPTASGIGGAGSDSVMGLCGFEGPGTRPAYRSSVRCVVNTPQIPMLSVSVTGAAPGGTPLIILSQATPSQFMRQSNLTAEPFHPTGVTPLPENYSTLIDSPALGIHSAGRRFTSHDSPHLPNRFERLSTDCGRG